MADTLTTISTHQADAIDRLLEQYKSTTKLKGIVSSLGDQYQEVEDVVWSLLAGRALATAVGEQLDKLGTIVDLTRTTGLSDEDYRTLLYVKVGQNTSQGDPPKLISVMKLLTGATRVFYQNLTRASVLLAVDVDLDPDDDYEDVIDLYENVEKLVGGGVRVDYLISYSPDDDAFAFAGTNVNAPAKGFGSTVDASAGGKLARIHRLLIPFGFDGLSSNRRGFGSLRDPLAGGTFVTT